MRCGCARPRCKRLGRPGGIELLRAEKRVDGRKQFGAGPILRPDDLSRDVAIPADEVCLGNHERAVILSDYTDGLGDLFARIAESREVDMMIGEKLLVGRRVIVLTD